VNELSLSVELSPWWTLKFILPTATIN